VRERETRARLREKPDWRADRFLGFTLRVAQRCAARSQLPLSSTSAPGLGTRPGRAKTLADGLTTCFHHAFDAPWFERAGPAGDVRGKLGA
jgi:hypothetical protein